MPPDQPPQVTFEKKTPVEESQVDRTDKEMGYPEDEQPLAAPIHHHPVPPLEMPHPFAESVEVPTASGITAKQEMLASPDSPPWCKVCKCCVCQLDR